MIEISLTNFHNRILKALQHWVSTIKIHVRSNVEKPQFNFWLPHRSIPEPNMVEKRKANCAAKAQAVLPQKGVCWVTRGRE